VTFFAPVPPTGVHAADATIKELKHDKNASKICGKVAETRPQSGRAGLLHFAA
jgi:hypothetical protein